MAQSKMSKIALVIPLLVLGLTSELWGTVLIWVGATNSKFGTSTNWSPAQTPTNGDTVVFDTGSVSVTGDLDQTDVELTSFIVGRGYTGNLGTSTSTPLQIHCDKMILWGGSSLYLSVKGEELYNLGTGSGGRGRVYLSGSDLDLLDIQAGDVVATSGTADVVYVDPSVGSTPSFTTGMVTQTLYIRGGSLSSTSSISSLYVDGGTTTISTGTYQNIITRGGRVTWTGTSTITNLTVFGGIFDCSYSSHPRSVTNTTLLNGGTLITNDGGSLINWVNGIKILGGTIQPAPAMNLGYNECG